MYFLSNKGTAVGKWVFVIFLIPESFTIKTTVKLKLFHTEDDAAGGLVILEQRREGDGALKIALHV